MPQHTIRGAMRAAGTQGVGDRGAWPGCSHRPQIKLRPLGGASPPSLTEHLHCPSSKPPGRGHGPKTGGHPRTEKAHRLSARHHGDSHPRGPRARPGKACQLRMASILKVTHGGDAHAGYSAGLKDIQPRWPRGLGDRGPGTAHTKRPESCEPVTRKGSGRAARTCVEGS